MSHGNPFNFGEPLPDEDEIEEDLVNVPHWVPRGDRPEDRRRRDAKPNYRPVLIGLSIVLVGVGLTCGLLAATAQPRSIGEQQSTIGGLLCSGIAFATGFICLVAMLVLKPGDEE